MSCLTSAAKLVVSCLMAVATLNAYAIEAPQQPPVPTEDPKPTRAAVERTDEAEFYRQLQRVTHYRNLRELEIPAEVIDQLGSGAADQAVAILNAAASTGNEHANIALVRIQHWCGRIASSRPPDAQGAIQKLSELLPPERAARAAGVLHAQADFSPVAIQGCRKAAFDYGAIENRLREAAEAGLPASATELAQFTRDPKKRDALLQIAAAKEYAPALYAIASQRVIDVQRRERTEDVGSIRLFLKQAGRSLPKAKLDLANCIALGCDGHPADAAAARAFGTDAAREGEPTAFLSMVRMPWGRRLTRTQLLAWQYFGDRLNEAGCMGEQYIQHATTFAQSIELLSRNAESKFLEEAKTEADKLWQANAPRAKKEQGCG